MENIEQVTVKEKNTFEQLSIKLDHIRSVLYSINLVLDSIQDDVNLIDKKVDSNQYDAYADMLNSKLELNSKIETIHDELNALDSQLDYTTSIANDAYSTADDNSTSINEIQDQIKEIENNVADVLLLKD